MSLVPAKPMQMALEVYKEEGSLYIVRTLSLEPKNIMEVRHQQRRKRQDQVGRLTTTDGTLNTIVWQVLIHIHIFVQLSTKSNHRTTRSIIKNFSHRSHGAYYYARMVGWFTFNAMHGKLSIGHGVCTSMKISAIKLKRFRCVIKRRANSMARLKDLFH